MVKRKVSKSQLNFLEEELEFCRKENIIDLQKKNEILENYDIERLNFVKVILIIGSILIGLGILSFIGSNWAELSKISKIFIIIGLYLGSNFFSFKLQEKYPKTSKSLLYLGQLVYGSGIFLMGQIFNYGGHFSGAFLLWGLGILPIAYLFKDKITFIFSHILFLVYLSGCYEIYDISYWIIIIIPILYYINMRFENSKIGTAFNNIILLDSILYFLYKYNVDDFYVTFIFLVIGMLMYYAPFKFNRNIFKTEGLIVIGIAGLILTGPDIWKVFEFMGNGTSISIVFSIIFFLYLLSQTKKGSLISLVFICITILRYYFDTFYNFMPKSVFFIIGGVILLGFGHYFEKLRNKNGGDFIEK